MSCQPEKRARAEAILGELAELGLMLARDLAVQARESEDGADKVALTAAFHKTSRMVRLTLALDAKLDRDAAREARDAAQDVERLEARAQFKAIQNAPDRSRTDPIERRKTRVRSLLNRLLWNESEGDSEEFEILTDDLDARLDEAARSADFEDLPIETLARRVIADMGLTGELTLSLCETPAGDALRQTPELSDTG